MSGWSTLDPDALGNPADAYKQIAEEPTMFPNVGTTTDVWNKAIDAAAEVVRKADYPQIDKDRIELAILRLRRHS